MNKIMDQMSQIKQDNEITRIQALNDLKILDTPTEERFDRITKVAQIMFDVPIALVSLVDTDRQWFKSCAGLSARETPRSMSFCSHAIQKEDVMTINDATKDERFANNPLVTGEPNIRFYAGKPIRGPNDQMVGTLCIIDRKPRDFSRADKSVLIDLATWVENEFKNTILTNSLKETTKKLSAAQEELLIQNQNLAQKVKEKTDQLLKNDRMVTIGSMASRIAHDLKNPLSIIQMSSELLRMDLEKHMDENMKLQCSSLQDAIMEINRIIDDVLNYARTTELKTDNHSVLTLVNNSLSNISIPKSLNITLPENDCQVRCDSRKMQAVFSNLIINGIQAMNKTGEIKIILKESPDFVTISFTDSGPGIPQENLEKIFEHLFTTKNDGTGLGLGICKSIINQHQGEITVQNNPTTFTITLPK